MRYRYAVVAASFIGACGSTVGRGVEQRPQLRSSAIPSVVASKAKPPSSSAPSASSTTPPRPPFPPAPFSTAMVLSGKHFYAWKLTPSRLDGDELIVAQSSGVWADVWGYDGDSDFRAKTFVIDASGHCAEDATLEKGLPSIGPLDLNKEPDLIFGFKKMGVETPMGTVPSAWHIGVRRIVALFGDRAAPWLVTTRGEDRPSADIDNEDGVRTSEVWQFGNAGWARRASTKRTDLEWRFAAPFAGGVLLAERDLDRKSKPPSPKWRLTSYGVAKGTIVPRLPDRPENEKCGKPRVTALFTFASGEVVVAGSTCDSKLSLELWSKGSTDPERAVLDLAYPPPGMLFALESLELLVASKDDASAELKHDAKGWTVAKATTSSDPLASFHLVIHGYDDVFAAERFWMQRDREVEVFGALTKDSSVLVSTRPMAQPCQLEAL